MTTIKYTKTKQFFGVFCFVFIFADAPIEFDMKEYNPDTCFYTTI